MENLGKGILRRDIEIIVDNNVKTATFEVGYEQMDNQYYWEKCKAYGMEAVRLQGLKAGQEVEVTGIRGDRGWDSNVTYVVESNVVNRKQELDLSDTDTHKELFIASNCYDHKKLIDIISSENVNAVTPNSMLHEFSTRYSLLENSIKVKDDFMTNYLIENGAKLDSYKVFNFINGNERTHNPIGLAITNGNENAIHSILEKRPDLLTKEHIELFQKVAMNRELSLTEIRDIADVIEPIAKERQIPFDSQSMSLMYDLKVTQSDNFKSFYNQIVNNNSGLVEHEKTKELSEFTAVLRNPDGDVIYSGDFKYGKKDGLHFNTHNNILTVANYDMGREAAVPKDVEIFVALKNDNLKQIENLTIRATIDRIQPDNIDFFQKYDYSKLSLVETAINENKNDIAKFLIEKGCKLEPYEIVDLQTKQSRTHDPLMLAIKNGNTEISDKIIKLRPELVTIGHKNEIEQRQKNGNFNQLKTLGADVSISEVQKNKELDQKLKLAVQDGDTDKVKDCILKGANVKILERSDYADLSEEKKHEVNAVIVGAIQEKTINNNDQGMNMKRGGEEHGNNLKM